MKIRGNAPRAFDRQTLGARHAATEAQRARGDVEQVGPGSEASMKHVARGMSVGRDFQHAQALQRTPDIRQYPGDNRIVLLAHFSEA